MVASMILAIIPAYNEQDNIVSTIEDIAPHVDEVVVVDDASQDGTVVRARETGVTVLKHKINRGQGAALETGHEYARMVGADAVVHFDADGQFCGEEVPQAYAHFVKHKADVLFGSRFLKDNTDVPAFKRYVMLPIGRIIDRSMGAPKLSDSHNGFRILSNHALETVRITQDRMAHATQIPMLVQKHNLAFVEFPVTVRYNEFGQGLKGGFNIIKELVFGKFI